MKDYYEYYFENNNNTQGRRDVDINVEIETGVFEKAEATLPFFGPVAELHEMADAVG